MVMWQPESSEKRPFSKKHRPEEIIIDHGVVRCAADVNKLDIIDFHRYSSLWRNPQHCLDGMSVALRGTVYTVIKNDLSLYPERTDFPGWRHTGDHESAGKLFWNYFHFCFKGELLFHDKPDFSGRIISSGESTPRIFVGDIGRASPIAILNGFHRRERNVYWISVSTDCLFLTILGRDYANENEDMHILNQALVPILKKKQLTAHIVYGNVFIEVPGGNLFIGNDDELTGMTGAQLKKRVGSALAGNWEREPIPRNYPRKKQDKYTQLPLL